jgi:A/G-specific adenine glycosylase
MPDGAAFARRIVRWQRQHGRQDLPWQGTRDPYRVWLSEVMLQQTQVTTVLDYYPRFVKAFPDVGRLAAAPLDRVLALWSGLGYYSRARNLHRCAQLVQQRFGGAFPRTGQALAELPGIGRSTAAAIAVFCFGERAAILDGNVKRVLSRAHGFGADLSRALNERALWQLAESLLPPRDIEASPQGLIDRGAPLCTARRPACVRCPVADRCVAFAEGRPEAYPLKHRRLVRGRRAHALLWLAHRDRLWLVRRPPHGVWAGLWSLPEFESIAALQSTIERWPGDGESLPEIDHALTHFDWRLAPYRWTLPARLGERRMSQLTAQLSAEPIAPPTAPPDEPSAAGRWLTHDEALQMGLPAPLRKLLMLL